MPLDEAKIKVEIKVSLKGDNVMRALDVLGIDPDSDPQQRRVGFIEDVSSGNGLPLFDANVVLRVREDPDGDDESTVKLRPCRVSQLTDKWIDERDGDERTLKIEQDWAGERQALAVSYDWKLPAGRIDDVAARDQSADRLFNKSQEQFLSDCGQLNVNLDALRLLPLIDTSKWENVSLGDVAEVCVERWTVDGLDNFLELSVRAKNIGDAPSLQEQLELGVKTRGLQPDDTQESKTKRVLAHLVERVRSARARP